MYVCMWGVSNSPFQANNARFHNTSSQSTSPLLLPTRHCIPIHTPS